jgi:hypothetical protein
LSAFSEVLGLEKEIERINHQLSVRKIMNLKSISGLLAGLPRPPTDSSLSEGEIFMRGGTDAKGAGFQRNRFQTQYREFSGGMENADRTGKIAASKARAVSAR